MMHIKQAGYDAAESGMSREANPYAVNTEEWFEWNLGYDLFIDEE